MILLRKPSVILLNQIAKISNYICTTNLKKKKKNWGQCPSIALFGGDESMNNFFNHLTMKIIQK